MSYNINDEITKMFGDSETDNKSSGWFKFKEGDNRVRLVSKFVAIGKHFSKSGFKGICVGRDNGCEGCKETQPSVRWLGYVIDRKDSEIKLAELPNIVFKQIGQLQDDEDYKFETMPMPYDISIKASGAGTKEVEYTVMARQKTALNAGELSQIEKLKDPSDVKDAMKEKQIKSMPKVDTMAETEYPTDEINADDIDFEAKND